ncbi:DNA mismatch repair protein MutL, partial [Escherichia coli]|nr:DNA mismatch repair protein MutL [Escherichia coli]
EMLARDRHPVVALFLQVPADQVDVNVHPAKTEVRFRDPALVRGMIVSGLRRALDEAGHRSVQRPSEAALGMWTSEPSAPAPQLWDAEPIPTPAPHYGPAPTHSSGSVQDRRPSFSAPPPLARA